MNDAPAKRIVVVNVFSSSYSGSTWFNLMLGTHSQFFSIGEIKHLTKPEGNVCTIHGNDCLVWSKFEWPSERNPFLQLHEITGHHYFVTNNSRKFLHYQEHQDIEVRFVFLVRDGRAVVASAQRKFSGQSTWRSSRIWRHEIRRNRRLMRRQHPDHWRAVRYETVQHDPGPVLKGLLGWLDVPYEAGMTDFWRKEHHFLGGNRGTLTSLIQKRENRDLPQTKIEMPGALQWNLDYYRNIDPSQFRDERWKSELTSRQRRIFALAAGGTNRMFGYSATLDAAPVWLEHSFE